MHVPATQPLLLLAAKWPDETVLSMCADNVQESVGNALTSSTPIENHSADDSATSGRRTTRMWNFTATRPPAADESLLPLCAGLKRHLQFGVETAEKQYLA